MRCTVCSFENPEGFRFCGSCGASLVSAGELAGERRRVTVAFADLVGYSTLAERIDAEELQTLIGETFAELRAEVEAREGRVEKFIGDAVVATFGASPAHEDDPFRALDAALAMLRAVSRRTDPTGEPLQLRIGVNSGLVVTHPEDGSGTGVLGDAVNVAARLQQAAEPGQVLVAEPVWRRVQLGYELEHVGSLAVKGRDQPVVAYRLVGTLPAPPLRRQAPLVGRGHELELLELLWTSAAKGNTHVVSVIGEPGVGKSRLLSEFPIRAGAADFRVTCTSGRAFGPFVELVGAVLGGLPADLDGFKEQAAVLGVDEDVAQHAGALLGLADAPPGVRTADQAQRRQVFAGVWQLLCAAPGGPALMVLDDLHWADRSSLELLEFVLERIEGPFMVVLAYRPGFEHVEQTALRASHTSVRLERLGPDESAALARGYLGVDDLPVDVERLVATRAEGNPFFIEELLQALLDFECLRVTDGRAVLESTDVDIPESVEGTILARVDRLSAAERDVLHRAAVVGDPFTTDVIVALLPDEKDVEGVLEGLRRAQLLVSIGPDRWTSKHALIRDVVYGTLLLRQRRALHREVAEVLEALGGRDPAVLDQLAEQYSKADAPEKARHFALAAGDLAAERMGFVEAASRYETALRLWDDRGEHDGADRPAVLMRLARAALLAGRPTGARTALIEAAAGWRTLDDAHREGEAIALLGRAHWEAGDGERARAALADAVALLDPLGPSPELVQALVWSSTFSMLEGHRDEGAAAARRGLELAERLGLDVARAHLLNTLGSCEVDGGDPAGADRLRQALVLAESTGDAEAIGRAYVNLSSCLAGLRALGESLAVSERGRDVMHRIGSPAFEWFVATNQAWVLAELGRFDESEVLCKDVLASQRGVVGVPGFVNAGNALAWVLLNRGRYDEARALLDEVSPDARRIGEPLVFARVLTVEAELEEARGNQAAAVEAAAEAVAVVTADFSPVYAAAAVAPAVRLLPAAQASALVDQFRAYADHPAFDAPVAEADGVLGDDVGASTRAADLHASFGAVCDEARCRLAAGQLDKARDLIERYGLENGPLGRRWRELSGESTS